MLNVDVIVVELTTLQPTTVMPILATPTVQGEAKLVPVKVTGIEAPWAPLVGLMEVSFCPAALAARASSRARFFVHIIAHSSRLTTRLRHRAPKPPPIPPDCSSPPATSFRSRTSGLLRPCP